MTWGLTAEEGRDADLFYVCEGRKEFDQNTRIHDIARAIGKKVILGELDGIYVEFKLTYNNYGDIFYLSPTSQYMVNNACACMFLWLTVDHQVDYSDIGQRSKYNLEPSGHPWAALVLFDAVLVGNSYS